MRRLVISPHPDDAVWSCGGVLGRWTGLGDDVTVVTVFDGDPPETVRPAQTVGPAQTPPDPATTTRRREDVAALSAWPVRLLSLGLPEARHRGNGRLYPGPLSRRRDICPADRGMIDVVADALRPHVVRADAVLLPLAERTHVDHLIARAGAERARAHRAGHHPTLSYYQEFPYAAVPGSADRLTVEEHPVDFGPWLRAALSYYSQVDALFGNALRFSRALARHARAADGRWVWRELRTATAERGSGRGCHAHRATRATPAPIRGRAGR